LRRFDRLLELASIQAMTTPEHIARSLPIWQGDVTITPLGGGITNVNLLVQDAHRRAVVRIGGDIAEHHIRRDVELACSRAAHAAGVAPAVLYAAPGALVIDYIDARTLRAADLCDDATLDMALALVMRVHHDVPKYLRGPAPLFWVFHTLRDYAARLDRAEVPALMAQAALLERAVGPVDLIFGHNDLLPANFLHDGARLWLIDWEYAGFNAPLFDLGAMANCGLSSAQERRMLTTYFGSSPDDGLWHRYMAMKAASALREAMWSMVSEVHSTLPVDYAAYTAANLATYHAAYAAFKET
jgi:thiamine kinase-like enzyme